MRNLRILAITYVILFSLGCAQTVLRPQIFTETHHRLFSLSDRTLAISIPQDKSQIVGRQWTLIIVPAGIVSVESINQLFVSSLQLNAGMQGISLRLVSDSEKNSVLAIEDIDISCSAKDLLFIRRIGCSVKTQVRVLDKTLLIEGDSHSYRFSGHREMIEPVLYEALNRCSDNLLSLII